MNDSAAPHEIELKLFASAAALELLRAHPDVAAAALGPWHRARLVNRYFDTPERALATQRMALRLRRIGRRWVQTLKASPHADAGLSTRHEWEMDVAGARLELDRFADTPLAQLGPPEALFRQLAPRFSTDFVRESRRLRLDDGTEVELAIDVGTIAAGRGKARRTLAISEVEIELMDGSADTVLRFASRLAREVPMLVLPASKAARGDALASGVAREPAKVDLPVPHGSEPAAAHVARVVAACQAALLANVHAVIAEAPLPDELGTREREPIADEFVHQARVAVRRMRSALRLFRDLFGARRYESLNARLRKAGAMLGAARDRDVFCAEMAGRVERVLAVDAVGGEAMIAVRAAAGLKRNAAHADLREFVMSSAFARCALAVERFVLHLAAGSSPTLSALAPELLETQLRRIVAPARRIAVLGETERHRLRIEVKRLRYALDLFGDLYDAAAVKPYRDALSELQDELGTLNDAAVAARLLDAMETSEAILLARERYGAWFAQRVAKRLPKVAALAVTLELTPRPWHGDEEKGASSS